MSEQNQDIYNMKLHETIFMPNGHSVLRVAGGWIYIVNMYDTQRTVFIPYNDEFQQQCSTH